MTTPPPDPMSSPNPGDELERSLKRSHRTVLAVIAACAATSALQPAAAGEPAAPDPVYTTAAVVLAVGVIVLRRTATSRVISPRTRLFLTLCTYTLAASLAILGTFIAMTLGEKQTGLVFALAAGIFCLRPPQPIDGLRRVTRPSSQGTGAPDPPPTRHPRQP